MIGFIRSRQPSVLIIRLEEFRKWISQLVCFFICMCVPVGECALIERGVRAAWTVHPNFPFFSVSLVPLAVLFHLITSSVHF